MVNGMFSLVANQRDSPRAIPRMEHDMPTDRPGYVQIDLDILSRGPIDPLAIQLPQLRCRAPRFP